MTASRWGLVRSPMRKPSRRNAPVGRLDQRLRWASFLKSKTSLPRWDSSRVSRNFFVVAVMEMVAASSLGTAWGKAVGTIPTVRKQIRSREDVLFIGELKPRGVLGSTRVWAISIRASGRQKVCYLFRLLAMYKV